MYIYRKIDDYLLEWKKLDERKPLILRGARQVGKSSSVKKLAKHFKYFIEIDFDLDKELHKIFEESIKPSEIIEKLAIATKTPIIENETLLFFDEIQKCLPAISSLRYFYEKMPNLHVIAAGSLLEFALEELPSFAVGRVRSIFMYPFSFNEFLQATANETLLTKKQNANLKNPLSESLHNLLLKQLRKFQILGGMPEVVKTYVKTENVYQSQQVLDDLILSYQDDFSKYKKQVPQSRINEVLQSVVKQTGGKFVFSKTTSTANHKQIKEALDLLIKAGIAIPTTHTAANGIPLGATINAKKRKIFALDTGIFLRMSNLNLSKILLNNDIDFINKGGLAELFFALEMLKYSSPFKKHHLFYWSREKYGSDAEIDFILQKEEEIIPVEIKSGRQGKMQSMWQFLKTHESKRGFRVSLENYSTYKNLEVFPLYSVSEIVQDL